ncbi:UDP-N-acetylglucosamine 2-epimerase [Paraburkholderia sp. 40]
MTGNTVVDAIDEVRASWSVTPPASPLPAWHGAQQHVLVTCHRRENFGDVLQDICRVLRDLCQRYSDYRWVFPVHLNPAVREPVHRELDGIPNLALIEPVDYPTSLYLISGSAVVVSDSGGIQEEAPTFGVPVVVMRNHTERREGVDAGFATLAGQSAASIESAVIGWLDDPARRAALRDRANPYGDGLASRRIVDSLRGRPVEVFVG